MTGINTPAPSLLQRLRLTAQAAAGVVVLPANAVIRDVLVVNATANAITGGLKFGTTSGAADIVAALAVGANALAFVADAALLKRYFSATAAQPVYFDAVTAWNSASVEIDVYYYQQ